MNYSPILAPVVALVAWTLLVMLWMVVTRMARVPPARASRSATSRPARAASTSTARPSRRAQWKSHNYNHLMEQPTIFYAIVLALALMDFGGGINDWLAWGYVGLRIVHSLVQCDGQCRRHRASPCSRSASLCLLGLTVHAGARDPPRLRDLSAEARRPARRGSTSGTGRPAAPSRACSRRRPASARRGRRSPGCS